MSKLDHLQKNLGYQFRDVALLNCALRHRSMGKDNNERLEFLGDAMLNFIIGNVLYHQFPHAREGELSRLRSSLVNATSLTNLAKHFALVDYLHVGLGEKKSGGLERTSIQSDAMEAIIGAIFLDSNFETCKSIVSTWYKSMLNTIQTGIDLKDPKTQLQEYLQGKKLPLPNYDIVEIRGEAHNQVFHVKCTVLGLKQTALGSGHSRRNAEQESASKFLELIKDE